MRKYWVEGWIHHANECWYPRQFGFYFYARDREEADRIIKEIDWIWWRVEDLSERQKLIERR